METRTISTVLLETNRGQLEGLPSNPRKVSKEKLEALKRSIQSSPEMLKLREPIVFPLPNGHFIAIGGNMRIRACKELGIDELLCKVLPRDTPMKKLREYTIKDNNSAGEDDWEILSAEWKAEELDSWGLTPESGWTDGKAILEQTTTANSKSKPKGLNWGRDGEESRCNMVPHLAVHEKEGTLL